MKEYRLFFIFFMLFIATLWVPVAFAASCQLDTQKMVINIADDITLNVHANAAPGTKLWEKHIPVSELKYTCTSDTTAEWRSMYSRPYTQSILQDVYMTEISGIGIRIKWPENATTNNTVPGDSGMATTCQYSCTVIASSLSIEFIQTGSIAKGTHSIPAGEIAYANVIPTAAPGNTLSILSVNLNSAVTINVTACTIVPSTTNVNLGNYNIAFFQNGTEQGAKKEFQIKIDCPQAQDIGLTIKPIIAAGFGSNKGEIGIESGPGYAKGFLIKLFDKGTYISNPLGFDEVKYNINTSLTKKYEAQIYVPTSVSRENDLSVGRIASSVQYTLVEY